MLCCRYNCGYLAVIIGIIAGVLLGVLYALGFIATGIIFWLYLVIGIAGIFLAPIYGVHGAAGATNRCFCHHRTLLLVFSIGAVVAATVGLILAGLGLVTAIAIVLAIATFFVAGLLTSTVCLANCLCDS